MVLGSRLETCWEDTGDGRSELAGNFSGDGLPHGRGSGEVLTLLSRVSLVSLYLSLSPSCISFVWDHSFYFRLLWGKC
jgi:hypothetical protein